MRLVRRKRPRTAATESKPGAELEPADASIVPEQALEEARSALAAERERLGNLEEELEVERSERAKLQRRLRRAERTGRAERPDGKPPARRMKQTARTEQVRRARAVRGKGNGAAPKRDKSRTWAAARQLAAEGFSQREIARRLGINRRTVARLVEAEEVPRYRRAPRGSMLDPLEPVMRVVLEERPGIGAPGMTEVLREHGYGGSVDLVRRRLRRLRQPG